MKPIKGAPWHTEFYAKATKTMGDTAGMKLRRFLDDHALEPEIRWKQWFEETYPDLSKKHESAIQEINTLWGSMIPADMEKFKAAVKRQIEATQWAIDKYIEHLKKEAVAA